MKTRSAWRDALLCASYANLCFLRVWAEAPPYVKPEVEFLFLSRLSGSYYLGGIASTLLLAAVLFVSVRLLHCYGRPGLDVWLDRCFLVGVLVPFNSFINATPGFTAWFRPATLIRVMGQTGGGIAGTVVAAVLVGCLMRPPHWLLKTTRLGLLLMSPMAPLTLGVAAWQSSQTVAGATSSPPAQAHTVNAPAPGRVVWIILDEWDYRLTFVDREPSLRLPVIDALSAQSFFATNALPPAAWTKVSILSLLTGTAWRDVRPLASGEVQLVGESKEERPWSGQSNLFQVVRNRGWRSAIVGWHIPYCRLLASAAPDCWSWESSFTVPLRAPDLASNMLLQFRQLVETKNQSLFGQPNRFFSVMSTQGELTSRAELIAADPKYDLVLIHLPILHRPHFYDRTTGTYTLRGNPFHGYVDALELADSVLGGITGRMKREGVFEGSNLLLTADHWCRTSDLIDGKSDRRIPFVLKLAHQTSQRRYDASFNTVQSRSILESILSGQIQSAQGLARRLDAVNLNRGAGTTPSFPADMAEGDAFAP